MLYFVFALDRCREPWESEALFTQLVKSSTKSVLLSVRTKSRFLVKVVGKEKIRTQLSNWYIWYINIYSISTVC